MSPAGRKMSKRKLREKGLHQELTIFLCDWESDSTALVLHAKLVETEHVRRSHGMHAGSQSSELSRPSHWPCLPNAGMSQGAAAARKAP